MTDEPAAWEDVQTEPRQCVCGRLLTEPASIALGLGPVCRRKLIPRAATVRDEQLALILPGVDHD